MLKPENLLIKIGTMINLSRHEDDDALIADQNLSGRVIARHEPDAIEVVIPDIDPDRTFFIHQPEVKKK
jgi:hypothetical protein